MKSCKRCSAPMKGQRNLCPECITEWMWCPYKEHVTLKTKDRRMSYCWPCWLEWQCLRHGGATQTCPYPECPQTFVSKRQALCLGHRRDFVICRDCGAVTHRTDCPSNAWRCRECVSLTAARNNLARKLLVLTAYSVGVGDQPECSCCKENFVAFLGIQHVNGDGGKRRAEDCNADNYMALARQLSRGVHRQDLVTMCMNCNHAIGNKPGMRRCPNSAHGGY